MECDKRGGVAAYMEGHNSVEYGRNGHDREMVIVQ